MRDPAGIIALRAPQYKDDPAIPEYIVDAAENTDRTAWGKNYNKAVALLALHRFECDRGTSKGGAGQVVEARVGMVSRKYREAKTNRDDLARTGWGLELLSLEAASIMGSGTTF